MAARTRFLGVGGLSVQVNGKSDPAAVRAAYDALFGGALDVDDLDAWLTTLTERLAVAEAAIEIARRQRAQIVAHLHDSLGRSYAEIAAAQEGLSPQRAGQLAAKGRPHITPISIAKETPMAQQFETPNGRLIAAAWKLGGESGTITLAALQAASGLGDAAFAAAVQAHIDANHLHIDPEGDEDGTVEVTTICGRRRIARVTVNL